MPNPTQPVRAVIYVPRTIEPQERYHAMVRCMDHRHRHGYTFAGLLTGVYTEISQMVGAGLVDVVLVADESHLPTNRVPRIEVADPYPPPPPTPPAPPRVRRQRTRVIRRTAAA